MDNCNGKTLLCDYHFFDYLDEIRQVNLRLWATLLLELKPATIMEYLVDRPESATMAANVSLDLMREMAEGEL